MRSNLGRDCTTAPGHEEDREETGSLKPSRRNRQARPGCEYLIFDGGYIRKIGTWDRALHGDMKAM